VTFGRSASGGDTRRYTLQVRVQGDSKITDAMRIGLEDWRRMQVSTVISGNHPDLISPSVGGITTRTATQFLVTPEELAPRGIPDRRIY
jgi:hypothetical protein